MKQAECYPRHNSLPNIARTYAIAIGLLLACGCAVSRGNIGDPITSESVSSLQPGSSTRVDAVAAFGAPDRILQINGREVLQYYHYDAKSSSLLLVLFNMSRLNIKSDDLYVFVRQDGIVDDVIFGKRTDRLTFQVWPFGD